MELAKYLEDFLNLPPTEQWRIGAKAVKKLRQLAKREYDGAFGDLIEKHISGACNCDELLKIIKGCEVLAYYSSSNLYSVLELINERINQLKPEDTDVAYAILQLQYLPNLKRVTSNEKKEPRKTSST